MRRSRALRHRFSLVGNGLKNPDDANDFLAGTLTDTAAKGDRIRMRSLRRRPFRRHSIVSPAVGGIEPTTVRGHAAERTENEVRTRPDRTGCGCRVHGRGATAR